LPKRKRVHVNKKTTNNLEKEMKGVGVKESSGAYTRYLITHNRRCKELGHSWLSISTQIIVCERCGAIKTDYDT